MRRLGSHGLNRLWKYHDCEILEKFAIRGRVLKSMHPFQGRLAFLAPRSTPKNSLPVEFSYAFGKGVDSPNPGKALRLQALFDVERWSATF
jgi:hypothetical protein